MKSIAPIQLYLPDHLR